MRKSNLITVLLAVALLGTCGLGLLVVYGSYAAFRSTGARLRLFENAAVSAVATETLRYAVRAPADLLIDTRAGDILVEADAALDDTIVVEQRAVAWAATEAEAKAAAEALQPRVENSPKSVRIEYRPPDTVDIGSVRQGRDSVSFVVRVPPSTNVTLSTGGGDIDVAGIAGSAELESSFGDIGASELRGRLAARSDNGAVTAEGIAAGEADVTLASSHGEVTARDVAGQAVSLSSASGRLTAEDVRARGEARFESSFGDIDIETITAEALGISTQNGAIDARQGRIDGPLVAESAFGEITLEDLLAQSYEVQSQNGAVTIEGAQGPLSVSSNFGAVTVTDATEAQLDLASDNGAISFSGSLDPDSDHALKSSFGKISLAIPPDSRFDVHLETAFGSVRSELPIAVSGEVDANNWSGALNGGGRRLELATQNGDIEISSWSMSAAAPASPSPTAPSEATPTQATPSSPEAASPQPQSTPSPQSTATP